MQETTMIYFFNLEPKVLSDGHVCGTSETFLKSLITKSLNKTAKSLIATSLNTFPFQEKLVLAGKSLVIPQNR